MARLPPLLPTPPASLKLRGAGAAFESRAPKLHRPLEPLRTAAQGILHRTVPLYSASRPQEPNPPPRSSRNQFQAPAPPKSKVRPRARSPPSISITQRPAEPKHAKRPRRGELEAAEAAVDGRGEGDTAVVSIFSSADGSSVENRPSHSHCKQPETSSVAVEDRPDPAIPGAEQKLGGGKRDAKTQTDHKLDVIDDEADSSEELTAPAKLSEVGNISAVVGCIAQELHPHPEDDFQHRQMPFVFKQLIC